MDLNTHINHLEEQNRKLFSSVHFVLLCFVFVALIGVLAYFLEPVFAIGMSGFVAFFLHYIYSNIVFRKLNARITLLQTKLEQSDR